MNFLPFICTFILTFDKCDCKKLHNILAVVQKFKYFSTQDFSRSIQKSLHNDKNRELDKLVFDFTIQCGPDLGEGILQRVVRK